MKDDTDRREEDGPRRMMKFVWDTLDFMCGASIQGGGPGSAGAKLWFHHYKDGCLHESVL